MDSLPPGMEEEEFQLPFERPDAIFDAVLEKAQSIIHLLLAIMVEDRPTCLIRINQRGVKFTVEQTKIMQASAFLMKDLFKTFNLKRDLIELRIDLKQFLKCLGIQSMSSDFEKYSDPEEFTMAEFSPTGTNISLGLKVDSDDSPLLMTFDETGAETTCQMNPLAEEMCFTVFPNVGKENETSKLIMVSELLAEVWDDLDLETSEKIGFTVGANPMKFQISTKGIYGDVNISLNQDSGEDCGFEKFDCSLTEPEECIFRLSLLKSSMMCVHLAKKSVIRTSCQGFISIQHELEIGPSKSAYIEYFCQSIDTSYDDAEITMPDI